MSTNTRAGLLALGLVGLGLAAPRAQGRGPVVHRLARDHESTLAAEVTRAPVLIRVTPVVVRGHVVTPRPEVTKVWSCDQVRPLHAGAPMYAGDLDAPRLVNAQLVTECGWVAP